MRKKMYWGIVTLIILLLGVTAVLLLRDTDTDPEIIYKTDVEPARKTETPIAEKPTARPGFKMVKHGDHWHEVPIDEPEIMQDEIEKPKAEEKQVPVPRNYGAGIIPNFGLVEFENPILGTPILLRTTNVPGIDIDWASLSQEELADTIAKLERGEISAPEGYRYKDAAGKLYFDENGYPIIHKKGEYRISVIWTMEFRPPPDVWEEYHELGAQKSLLERDVDDSPEIRALEAKMEEMERTYEGPLPDGYVRSGFSPVGDTGPASRSDRMTNRIRGDIYRHMGFGYLLTIPE